MWIRRNELTGYVDANGKELKHNDTVINISTKEIGYIYIHDAIEKDADGELTIEIVQIAVDFLAKSEGDYNRREHPIGQKLKEYMIWKWEIE